MVNKDYCVLMANYNRWMNDKLYGLCKKFSEAQLREDRGAFFSSLFHTLNHLVYSDLAFLSRFTGDPGQPPQLGEELAGSFEELWTLRSELDDRIERWASSLTDEWLLNNTSYRSMVDGNVRTLPSWMLVTHMFNHQTHHRGQITTLLSQERIDFGSTDIPFMPEMAKYID